MSGSERRAPPHNADAEASVLGAVMLRNEAMRGIGALAPEDFYDPRHREVFAAMRTLADAQRPIDPVTLEDELSRTGRLQSIGGLSALSELIDRVPTADNVAHYAEIVADAARRRRLIAEASEIAARGFDEAQSLPELAARLHVAADAANGNGGGGPAGAAPLRAFGEAAVRRLLARAEGQERPLALEWGGLNAAMGGGLWPGLHVLVGNTGSGKTQLAMQAALEAAKAGTPVLYVGLELGSMDLVARLVSLRARRRWSALFLGQDREAARDLVGHANELMALPFHMQIAPPFGWYYSHLYGAAAGLRAAFPEDRDAAGRPIRGSRPMLVVVDFLQLISSPNAGESLRERIGRASYEARRVARDLDAAVVLISSTARDKYEALNPPEGASAEQLGNPAALVGLGKESGEIEYSADTVLVMQRETWEGEQPPEWTNVHVAIAKARAARPCRVTLKFNGGWFEEPDAVETISRASGSRARR